MSDLDVQGSPHVRPKLITIDRFPELFPRFIFIYSARLFLWFLFTIVEPEKWEGQNGQPKEENLRC